MREALARLKATPEEKRAKLRAYYAEHSEAAAKASQVYYEKNKDYIQEVQRVCRENKLTAEDRNRRARKAVERLNRKHRVRSGGKVSKGLFALLYFRQQGGCVYCGKNLDTGFHRDHIMPIALGGSNTDDNMQLLCPECNIAKGARYPNEYEDSIGFKRGGTT
jgi:5-methylcytosine-specific restriction endonuclease McrA